MFFIGTVLYGYVSEARIHVSLHLNNGPSAPICHFSPVVDPYHKKMSPILNLLSTISTAKFSGLQVTVVFLKPHLKTRLYCISCLLVTCLDRPFTNFRTIEKGVPTYFFRMITILS